MKARARWQLPQGVARDQITRWMADGRSDKVIGAYEKETQRWADDAYLQLQLGDALAQHDRLAEAQAAYERARDMASASAEQKTFAGRRLDWIESEWKRIDDVRGALGRGYALGVGGLAVLGVCVGFTWLCARRAERAADA